MYICRICGSGQAKDFFTAREMMFGTREKFEYVQCNDCNSIQIVNIPNSDILQHHYPDDYYSFMDASESASQNKLKIFLQSQRDNYELGFGNFVGFILSRRKPMHVHYRLFRMLNIKKHAKILDVGCGSGVLLDFLASKGFCNLKGVDPFNSSKIITRHGASIDNCDIHSLKENFDVVMFHHALEHVPDPVSVLKKSHNILRKSGICIVRIPTCSSLAWETYGVNWVQLDAPRHLTIPSRVGMEILGQKSQLRLERTIDDSTSFQFWASEQYEKDVSLLRNGVTKQIGIPALDFGAAAMQDYDRRSKQANLSGRGDQAAFVYRKY